VELNGQIQHLQEELILARLFAAITIVFLILFADQSPVVAAAQQPYDGAVMQGVRLGSSLAEFKNALAAAHITGLKKVEHPDADKGEASYRADGAYLGTVKWNPEFEFANDHGVYRLVCIVGEIPRKQLREASAMLAHQYGSKQKEFWTVGKRTPTSIALGMKSSSLWYEDNSLWNEYVKGPLQAPRWYEHWIEKDEQAAKAADTSSAPQTKQQSSSGNLARLQGILEKFGFVYTKSINDFLLYSKKGEKGTTISIRSCDGYVCEAVLTALPMSEEQLLINVMPLYLSLEKSLAENQKESVDVANSAMLNERASALVSQIMGNLSQSNRTEFAFDHLNVRGTCDPVSDEEARRGKQPVLVLKLWLP